MVVATRMVETEMPALAPGEREVAGAGVGGRGGTADGVEVVEVVSLGEGRVEVVLVE